MDFENIKPKPEEALKDNDPEKKGKMNPPLAKQIAAETRREEEELTKMTEGLDQQRKN